MDFLKVFIFSFTISIIIGPIAILIINYGLNGGIKKAWKANFGVLTGSFILAVLAFYVSLYFMNPISLDSKPIKITTSILLLVFGSWMIYNSLAKQVLQSNLKTNKKKLSPFLSTFLLAFINPFNFLAYLTFSSELDVTSFSKVLIYSLIAAAASFIAIGFYVIFSGYFLYKLKNPCVLKYINIGSGVLIIGFGIFNLIP